MIGYFIVEWIEMVEGRYGFVASNSMVKNSQLETNGHYSGIELYEISELEKMARNLSEQIKKSVNEIYIEFGNFLAMKFNIRYKNYLRNDIDFFNILRASPGLILIEAHKLFPNCEIPEIEFQEVNSESLVFTFKFSEKVKGIIQGLIEGLGEIYGLNLEISIEENDAFGNELLFKLVKQDLVEEEQEEDG